MDTSWNVYDYPQAPEHDETEITIYLTLKTTDAFPETWDEEQMKDYIKGNVRDYIYDADIEINEIEV